MSQVGQFITAAGAGFVQTLTGSSGGGAIPPDGAGNITLTAGAGITCTGAGNAITIASTGALGTTDHAVQVGNALGGLTSLAVGATGTVLAGSTGANPSFTATPTVTTMNATTFDTNVAAAAVTLSGTTLSADGTDANININITAKGSGTVIIDELTLTTDLAVTEGGTGASTLTDHGVLLGSGTGAITATAVGATGEVFIGNTGADATWSSTPTVTTIYATTFDTNIAAAAVTLSGTTLSCDGTDANINLNFATKGTGAFIYDGINTGWAQSEWRMAQVSVQTADATPTNILAIPLVNSLMVSVKILVNGFQDDYTDCLGGEIMVTAYRSAAGNITLVGAPIINVNYTDTLNTSDIDANVSVGTQSLQIQVIGVAAENWNWVGTYQYMYTISNL